MATRKLQVFISSTYLDLKDERQAVVEGVLQARHIPAGMELFSAGNESQWEYIKHWIQESDVLLLLLGTRYGSIKPKSGKSYVELEHDYAVEQRIPVLRFVMDAKWNERKIHELGPNAIDDYRKQWQKFRSKLLKDNMCAMVSDKSDLTQKVERSLRDYADQNPLSGWVRGNTSILKNELTANLRTTDGSAIRVVEAAERIAGTPFGIFDLFKHAKKKLFIAAQNHYWYAGHADRQKMFEEHLQSFLSVPGRSVTILLNDVNDEAAVQTWTKIQVEAFPLHLRQATDFLKGLLVKAGPGGPLFGLRVRTVPHVPFSVNFVDPDDDDGFLILTPNAFELESMGRPCFIISRRTDPGIFLAYWSPFNHHGQDGFSEPI